MAQAPIDPRWPKILSLSVHEFRTPVTVVGGYIRMLLKDRAGTLTDPQRRMLEEAEKSCGRLSALIAEMSELSTLEAGTAPFNRSRTDLHPIVEQAVAQLPPLPDREIAVTLELTSDAAPIDADPVRLAQALSSVIAGLRRELIGDEALIVRERRTDAAYELLIGDLPTIEALEAEPEAGHGIFDEWRGGVGLSLAVARRILNAHGGSITAAPDGRKAGARIRISKP